MKKTVLTVMVLFFLTWSGISNAETHKSLWVQGYMVDVPETLPLELEELEMEIVRTVSFGPEESFRLLIVAEFEYPDFVFRDKDGKRISPYMEVFQLSSVGLKFVAVSFVNARGELEIFSDDILLGILSGKLERRRPSENLRGIFKKVPRYSTTPDERFKVVPKKDTVI